MPRNLYMKYYVLAIISIVVDQVVKLLIRTNMELNQSIKILGDFFKLTYIKNSGAAFSMLAGQKIILIGIPIAAIIIVVLYLHKHKEISSFVKTALALILSGGIGNLIDRFAFGEVTDMLDFSVFPPIFNVADICVTIGCILLIVYVVFGEKLKCSKSK